MHFPEASSFEEVLLLLILNFMGLVVSKICFFPKNIVIFIVWTKNMININCRHSCVFIACRVPYYPHVLLPTLIMFLQFFFYFFTTNQLFVVLVINNLNIQLHLSGSFYQDFFIRVFYQVFFANYHFHPFTNTHTFFCNFLCEMTTSPFQLHCM